MDTDTLVERITEYVTSQMQPHDPSHNPAHVFRVHNLALKILSSERSKPHNVIYNDRIVTLAALMHDIGDRKYLAPCELTGQLVNPESTVYDILVSRGADSLLAQRVQTIVANVSYTNEAADPTQVRKLIGKEGGYPELAIVQDADRLDALGAVGIGRCFTYLGAKSVELGKGRRKSSEDTDVEIHMDGDGDGDRDVDGGGDKGSRRESRAKRTLELDDAIAHFEEKLLKLEGMMKTESGKEMARARTARIKEFHNWWVEETGQ